MSSSPPCADILTKQQSFNIYLLRVLRQSEQVNTGHMEDYNNPKLASLLHSCFEPIHLMNSQIIIKSWRSHLSQQRNWEAYQRLLPILIQLQDLSKYVPCGHAPYYY